MPSTHVHIHIDIPTHIQLKIKPLKDTEGQNIMRDLFSSSSELMPPPSDSRRSIHFTSLGLCRLHRDKKQRPSYVLVHDLGGHSLKVESHGTLIKV